MKQGKKGLVVAICFFFCLNDIIVSGYLNNNGEVVNPDSIGLRGKIPGRDFVPDEILVKFKPGTSSVKVQNIINRLQIPAQVARQAKNQISQSDGLVRVHLMAGYDVMSSIQSISSDSNVEYAQPNYIYHMSMVPNDPSYGQQWAFKNTGQIIASGQYTSHNPGTSGDDLNMEAAWDYITDCSSVIVAVIDTGVNYNHTELASNMWNGSSCVDDGGTVLGGCIHGYNYVQNNNDPLDMNGHGSHVAGIIGAAGNNSSGVSGVCPVATIMAVRVLDASGSGYSSDIVRGINFAWRNGAKVINMSLGGGGNDTATNNAIVAAGAAGTVVVVAAGNDGKHLDNNWQDYPCMSLNPNLICVAAIDQAYSIASFSNFSSSYVHVASPGTNIQSTFLDRTPIVALDNFATWTKTGGWAPINSGILNVCTSYWQLVNPSSWCLSSTATYANNENSSAYNTFSGLNIPGPVVNFFAYWDMENNYDYFRFNFATGAVNPILSSGNIMDATGSTAPYYYYQAFDLTGCDTGTGCSIGFGLSSDASNSYNGIAIMQFNIDAPNFTTNAYGVLDGTSMATPYVAGIAAMIYTYNPGYGVAETVDSVINGGDVIPGLKYLTQTSRVVDGFGSLTYIARPTGVTLAVQ